MGLFNKAQANWVEENRKFLEDPNTSISDLIYEAGLNLSTQELREVVIVYAYLKKLKFVLQIVTVVGKGEQAWLELENCKVYPVSKNLDPNLNSLELLSQMSQQMDSEEFPKEVIQYIAKTVEIRGL